MRTTYKKKRIKACNRKVRILTRLLSLPDYEAWVVEDLAYYEEELDRLKS